MSGTITHSWNGTVLTITSDAGTSSMDLQGNDGCRGPQGPAGVIYDEDGNVVVDLSPFAFKSELDALDQETENEVIRIDIALQTKASYDDVNKMLKDTSFADYATKNYVSTEIAKAQMEGAGVDTSGFVTKDELAAHEFSIDNKTIVKDEDGNIRTAIGGFYDPTVFKVIAYPNTVMLMGYPTNPSNQSFRFDCNHPLVGDEAYVLEATFSNGVVEKTNFLMKSIGGTSGQCVCQFEFSNNFGNIWYYPDSANGYILLGGANEPAQAGELFTQLRIYTPGGSAYTPIDPEYIPIDGTSIIIKDGKLTSSASVVDLSPYYTKTEIDNKDFATITYVDNLVNNQITYGLDDLEAGISELASGTIYLVYE